MVSIIVAVAEGGVIGKSGGLPWYLPADLLHFKEVTMGHPIIMGRVTHQSIGKALPGRLNIVITNDRSFEAEGCQVVGSLEKALEKAKKAPGSKEIFIIGGESIYQQALPITDKIYLTKVHAKINGDKHFIFDPSEWKKVSSESHFADEKNKYNYDFIVYQKRAG